MACRGLDKQLCISCHGLCRDDRFLKYKGIQSDITAVKEYASDLQTFLGSKAIEEEVTKEEKYIMALSEDGCLQQLNLKCSMDKKIKDQFVFHLLSLTPHKVVLKGYLFLI
jgi:hypothetical protein